MALFSKKEYDFLARFISELDVGKFTRRALANAMADKLSVDNQRFSKERFLSACLPEGENF